MYNFLKLKWNEKKHTYKCIYFFFNTTGSLKSNSYRYLKSQSNKLFQLQTNKTIFILFLSLIKTFILLFFFCYDKPNFFFNILFWPTFHNRKKRAAATNTSFIWVWSGIKIYNEVVVAVVFVCNSYSNLQL